MAFRFLGPRPWFNASCRFRLRMKEAVCGELTWLPRETCQFTLSTLTPDRRQAFEVQAKQSFREFSYALECILMCEVTQGSPVTMEAAFARLHAQLTAKDGFGPSRCL